MNHAQDINLLSTTILSRTHIKPHMPRSSSTAIQTGRLSLSPLFRNISASGPVLLFDKLNPSNAYYFHPVWPSKKKLPLSYGSGTSMLYSSGFGGLTICTYEHGVVTVIKWAETCFRRDEIRMLKLKLDFRPETSPEPAVIKLFNGAFFCFSGTDGAGIHKGELTNGSGDHLTLTCPTRLYPTISTAPLSEVSLEADDEDEQVEIQNIEEAAVQRMRTRLVNLGLHFLGDGATYSGQENDEHVGTFESNPVIHGCDSPTVAENNSKFETALSTQILSHSIPPRLGIKPTYSPMLLKVGPSKPILRSPRVNFKGEQRKSARRKGSIFLQCSQQHKLKARMDLGSRGETDRTARKHRLKFRQEAALRIHFERVKSRTKEWESSWKKMATITKQSFLTGSPKDGTISSCST